MNSEGGRAMIGNQPAGEGSHGSGVREQDMFMPIANVVRIMRRVLPAQAKISDDAKETIQECVSEYISFITGEANVRCQREQRKTVTAEDVLWALGKLGFDNYVEPLTIFLKRYREVENSQRMPIFNRRSTPGIDGHHVPIMGSAAPGTYGTNDHQRYFNPIGMQGVRYSGGETSDGCSPSSSSRISLYDADCFDPFSHLD